MELECRRGRIPGSERRRWRSWRTTFSWKRFASSSRSEGVRDFRPDLAREVQEGRLQRKMVAKAQSQDFMDRIVSLAKRRGFVYQSSEIYGGLNGCWDYGPLGVEMLNNLKQQWWRAMTYREDVEGVDASVLMHPRVWEASGHVENFTDPMVDCTH